MQAEYLKNASWGIDNSEVNEENYHKNNSISTTQTLPHDTVDTDKLKDYLLIQTERVTRELREKNKYANTVSVIFKDNQFISYSAQEKLNNSTDDTRAIYKKVVEIFDKNFKGVALRLIGVRLSELTDHKNKQISLFEMVEEKEENSSIQKTIDDLNKKFGNDLIIPASLKIIGKNKEEK